MFKIIGADQKEYGPVSTAQIRQWITDGRLNATTKAQRATGGDWQPLSAFEEFADIFNPAGAASTPDATAPAAASEAPAAAPLPTASREMALLSVKGPAMALMIISAIGIAVYVLAILIFLFGLGLNMSSLSPEMRRVLIANQGVVGILRALFGLAMNGAILYGAIKMMRLQGHTFAIVTCILAMLPCSCCCFFGMPFGIWGLVVLNKPEVKSQFTN
jgi:hypothetical protein